MIQKSFLPLQWIGFGVTSLLGTVLHFLYSWTCSPLSAPFSSVNESTWEHMKLLFWPMSVYAVVQRCFLRDKAHFWNIKLSGMIVGLGLIPVLFYTYNGVIGPSPDWINIAIFFVAAAASYFVEARLFVHGSRAWLPDWMAPCVLIAIGVLFVWFTFFTPMIGIFRDPLSGTYGISGC